jgi:hypothetical protein
MPTTAAAAAAILPLPLCIPLPHQRGPPLSPFWIQVAEHALAEARAFRAAAAAAAAPAAAAPEREFARAAAAVLEQVSSRGGPARPRRVAAAPCAAPA